MALKVYRVYTCTWRVGIRKGCQLILADNIDAARHQFQQSLKKRPDYQTLTVDVQPGGSYLKPEY